MKHTPMAAYFMPQSSANVFSGASNNSACSASCTYRPSVRLNTGTTCFEALIHVEALYASIEQDLLIRSYLNSFFLPLHVALSERKVCVCTSADIQRYCAIRWLLCVHNLLTNCWAEFQTTTLNHCCDRGQPTTACHQYNMFDLLVIDVCTERFLNLKSLSHWYRQINTGICG